MNEPQKTGWIAAGVALIMAATLTGCTTTYRWDRAECASVGMWDQPPSGCWCPDQGRARCTAMTRRAAEVDRGWLHLQQPEVGRRDVIGDQPGVVTRVDRSARGHPTPETVRWVQMRETTP